MLPVLSIIVVRVRILVGLVVDIEGGFGAVVPEVVVEELCIFHVYN